MLINAPTAPPLKLGHISCSLLAGLGAQSINNMLKALIKGCSLCAGFGVAQVLDDRLVRGTHLPFQVSVEALEEILEQQ